MGSSIGPFVTHKFETCPGWGGKSVDSFSNRKYPSPDSRPTVRKVLRSNAAEVPEVHRAEKAEPYRQRILELFSNCKGNLVRRSFP
jgi:hypothetical protein